MGGGVDNSVAALLVKRPSHDATGVTMRLYDNDTIGSDILKHANLENINDARGVLS